jgi:hypothetical protein
VEDAEHQRVGSGNNESGPNLYLIAVLAALPMAILIGMNIGDSGKIAGSHRAFTWAAVVVAYIALVTVITVVREAYHRRSVGVGFLGGTKVDPTGGDPEVTQHEALAQQAKTVEKVGGAVTEQLAHEQELLRGERDRADAERDRADTERARADREKARADALEAEVREARAGRFTRDPGDPRQDSPVRETNPTHEERPPG